MNILWDAIASLALARATGARFIREVLTGVYESDLGMIEPRIGEIAGYRTMIGAADVALFDNILPEFASAIGSRGVAERAKGAAFLGMDAILISGPAAGIPFEMSDLRAAKDAAPTARRSSPTPASGPIASTEIFAVADGAIVGTSLKVDGVTWNPVDRGPRDAPDGCRRGPSAPRRRAAERSMARKTKVYFATDLHGSSKCFRKFVNAGAAYGVDVLILGGDVAGQGAPDDRPRDRRPVSAARSSGRATRSTTGPDLEALEKLIADHGYYPYRAEAGELDARRADGSLDGLFVELMRERLTGWLTLADERLRPTGQAALLHARQRRSRSSSGRCSTRRRGASTTRARW